MNCKLEGYQIIKKITIMKISAAHITKPPTIKIIDLLFLFYSNFSNFILKLIPNIRGYYRAQAHYMDYQFM